MADYTPGDQVDYRPVVSIPCDPIPSTVVEIHRATQERGYYDTFLIDCGPTGYAAPHDRDRRIVHRYQLTPA